ncbi:hypothetical protein ACI8AC_00035 [Geodermatophilus sp. SYSU D00758]
MRRLLTVVSAVLLALGTTTALAPAAAATTCPVLPWGSLPEVAGDLAAEPVADVRTGRHPCFDRVVFDIGGPGPHAWDVRYVDVVHQAGSGFPHPVPGGAVLSVRLGHPVHDRSAGGLLVFDEPAGPVADVGGHDTLRAVHLVGSFEGQTQFAVGVRARLPVRVFALDGPGAASRVVLDVAHRWHAW